MPLSCECGAWDDGDWRYYPVSGEFQPLQTIRRRRCKSCDTLIDLGSLCLIFERYREILYDIEEKIYGEGAEVPLAAWYLCESCGELFLNLTELGFCVEVEEDLRVVMQEYLQEYNPTWRPPK